MGATGDRRRWNDDELRQAVQDSVSWRAVARALGLKDTSAATIRRHAARLELDTSHFTGQRRWSDQQLREAVAGSSCWADVITALGIVDNGAERVRIKGHAVRLGLGCSHLRSPHTKSAPDEVFDEPVQPEMLRYSAAALAMAWFTLRGCTVALPIEPQAYDLLVTTPKGIQRVQVKSCAARTAKGYWNVGIGRRPYVLDKSASKMPYDPDSIDLFFIVLGDGSIYVIPSSVLAGRVGISAESYLPYRVGDASSMLGGAPAVADAPGRASAYAGEFVGSRFLREVKGFAFDIYSGGEAV
ncbi:group I intron-associated PD-(D/E)XK endonuclease [Kribbella sp.]|uniref:group I intron-associated PD-(D/E)XK endonuclease n=1 Tax=Kribbella sp. TaxID=1871183 RepID=UPI002D57538B|nr:group I intron-associated PD-(D/E)XK endonuclease [Kribbella sp.]HZX07553.1 group I intron-associated PD-(D/E)XK endonuclease [Kribbella sp.]